MDRLAELLSLIYVIYDSVLSRNRHIYIAIVYICASVCGHGKLSVPAPPGAYI